MVQCSQILPPCPRLPQSLFHLLLDETHAWDAKVGVFVAFAIVLDAAHLAIHFSPVRGTDRAPVHVVAAKHVHKPKGAKPGLVSLSGGRILEVRVQHERLEALLRGNQRG